MTTKHFLFIAVLCFTVACSPKSWQVTKATSVKIALDASTEAIADKSYENYIQPVKQRVDAEMNVVIGKAAETMKAHKPESLLSNWNADVYKQAAGDYLKSGVDIAIVNLGGLRTQIPAGNITVRNIFELMPFENELVILWLKGDKLLELLNFFAEIGGQGVSGIRMKIENNKATNILINNEPLDVNKTYSIATNDYLAGGNDKMLQLAQYDKRINTGIKIRNMLLDYVKNATKNGEIIQSKLDGRISKAGN